MATAVASMAGLRGASQVVLEGGLVSSTNARVLSSNISSSSRVAVCAAGKPVVVAALSQQSEELHAQSQSRRSVLSLLAASVAATAFVKDAHAAATSIKLEGPPPPSGGLPGTENSDQARDTDLPLKERFFIQPKTPIEAAARAKESAKDIVGVKDLIAKKAWPYVQNGLRSSAGYLRYDLATIISSKPKEEKKTLKALSAKLFDSLDALDFAARSKSPVKAEKSYAEAVNILNDVLAKIA